MALIIEDGTAKSDAQSYATVVEMRSYADLRGATVPRTGTAGDEQCEILLMKAMDYIEGQNFVGEKRTKEQALQWPRLYACVENWPINPDEIPRQLIQAQCALAIEAQTVDLLPTINIDRKGPVVAQSVTGAVSVAYANPGEVRNVPAIAKARTLLRVLLKHSGLTAIRS